MKKEKIRQFAFSEEKAFLDKASETYVISSSSQDRLMRELAVRTFAPFIKGGRALELGCFDGYMTDLISRLVDTLDVIEGSKEFLKEAEKRNLQNVRFIYALFEEFKSDIRYDYVFATYVFEHVLDVKQVLRMIRSVL